MPGTPFLTGPGDDRVATLRAFLGGHQVAYGLAGGQVDELVVVADQMNPAGNMAWVELEQQINGIPVFQGQLRGAFTAKGELARTNGRLATGVGAGLPSSPALSAAQAVAIAAATVGLPATEATLRERERIDGRIVFEPGAMADAPRAWLVYSSWRTEWRAWRGPRKCSAIRSPSSRSWTPRPARCSSARTSPTSRRSRPPTTSTPATARPRRRPRRPCLAPATSHRSSSRQSVTLIGNEAPYSFNNLGWITDGANGVNGHTDGNNVEAGVDRVAPNGVDAVVPGTNRSFSFSYNPGPGNPPPGGDALDARLPERRSDQPVLLGQPLPRRDLPVRVHRAVPQLPARQLRPRRRRRRPDQRRGPGLVRHQQRELLDRRRRHARPPAGVPLDRTRPPTTAAASTPTSCSTS